MATLTANGLYYQQVNEGATPSPTGWTLDADGTFAGTPGLRYLWEFVGPSGSPTPIINDVILVLGSVSSQTLQEGATITFTPTVLQGTNPRWSVSGPAWASINQSTGLVSLSPPLGVVGAFEVGVSAGNTCNVATQLFTATVTAAAIPAVPVVGDWSLANVPSPGANTLAVTLTSLEVGATFYKVSINGAAGVLLTNSPATGTPYNFTVPASALANIRIIAGNSAGDSLPSDTKQQTPGTGGGVTAVSQGGVTFPFSPARVVGYAFDGSCYIVVPNGGTVTMNDPTPAVTTMVEGATTYTINGVAVNLQRDAAAPFDQRQAGNWNAGAMATFPRVLNPGDIVQKQISNQALAVAQIRQGTAQEFAVCHIIDQSTFDALQAAGGIANHLSPAPWGWAGRTNVQSEWRRVDMDALFAARPNSGAGLSLAGVQIPNDANMSIPETVARLDRFNAPLISRTATGVTGSYETASISNYAGTGGNYGVTMVEGFRRVYLAFIGDRPRGEIEPAIRRFVALGSWFYDSEVGRGTNVYKPDGGHHIFMLVPMMLGLRATNRTASIATLSTVTRQNQLHGWQQMTAPNLARLTRHNNPDQTTGDPFPYLERDIDSVVGRRINMTVIAGDLPFYRNFYGLECRRVRGDAFMGICDRTTASDGSLNNWTTIDRDPIDLLDTDRVYFAAPPGWISLNDYVWAVGGTMKSLSPGPRPTYSNVNQWAAECLFERAMGWYSAQFDAMEALTKRRVYETDERPSDMVGAGGKILGFTAFGEAYVNDNPVENDNSRFTKTFWQAHAVALGLGNVSAPVNTVAPVPTGTMMVGQTITIPRGTWSESVDSYSCVGTNGAIPVDTGTGWTCTIPESAKGNPIVFTVTATNAAGSGSVVCAPTEVVLPDYVIFYPMTDLTNVTRASSFAAYNPTPAFTLVPPIFGTTGGSIAALMNGQPSFTIRKSLWPFAGGADGDPSNPARIKDSDLFVIPFSGAMNGAVPDVNGGVVTNVRMTVNGFSHTFDAANSVDQFSASHRLGRGFVGIGAISMRNTNWAGAKLSSSAPGNVTIDVTAPANVPLGQQTARFGPVYRIKGQRFKPTVVITYDDVNPEQHSEIFPRMQAQNIPGSMYALTHPTNGIGSGSKLSVAQCQEMRDAGWSINLDGHAEGWIFSQPGSIAETIAALNANGDRLRNVLGLASEDDCRHICFSFGHHMYPTGGSLVSMTADGSDILTLGAGSLNSFNPMMGCFVIGSGVPVGTRVVRMLNNTQLRVDRNVLSGPVSVRFSGGTAPGANGHACVGNGNMVVTGIVTQALAPGMQMIGRDVPPNTLIQSVDSASQITVTNPGNSPIPVGTVWAQFFIPGAEWNYGNFQQAAYAAGYRTGRRVGIGGYGLCTQFGITQEAGFEISGPSAEQTTSTAAIANIGRNINDGNDCVLLSHGNGNFTAHNEIFVYIRQQINNGNLDCMNLTDWYNTASRRRGPL